MKSLLLLLFLSPFLTNGQSSTGLTPDLRKNIDKRIEDAAQVKRNQLTALKLSMLEIDFTLDTFRIEQYLIEYIRLDNSDYGMSNAGYEAAKQYDNLLNKYYKKLLATLNTEDKNILTNAQKTWLAFRDSEAKLIGTISKEEYAGGGTMQRLTESSEFLEMVRSRTVSLYNHLTRATQAD